MIVLDTNIISELMKSAPAHTVLRWMDQQDSNELFITTITLAEISYGISVLPTGNRKRFIEEAFEKSIAESFKHRILSFEEPAAYLYGKIMGHRKKRGNPLSILDGQIAAIALFHNASLATRNIRDFENYQLNLINPFNLEHQTPKSHISA